MNTTISTNKPKACSSRASSRTSSKLATLSPHDVTVLTIHSFKNDLYGVPGNSDAGALNSWLIWQMLGLYPVATQPIYLLVSPWFSDINMTINGDKQLRITANGLDNSEAYYVQSVRINGEEWDRNWFEHADVMVEGGVIEFEMGREMVFWEEGDVPPSPGHEGVPMGRMTEA